ncbi:MAG: ABC transporter ATP-binding protein [Acidimicrobiia bacterium]|nr:ABC transporter ATP-binding protein [Acidimicrobiia bacterium]MYB25245.1 ABC transporter ATP-binding protein [Acidimicrobiia bacterium]MYE66864.1 ABC transporter ATP-binding protein [Acidimicrobiia bacterium]
MTATGPKSPPVGSPGPRQQSVEAAVAGWREQRRANGAAARAIGAVKIYGKGETEVRALDGVDVSFDAGELTTIMGPSGSGKSTLMHCMAGLDDVTDGRIFIGDTELGSLNERELTLLRRRQVGFIFQAYNLLPTLTALENMTLPISLAGEEPDSAWLSEVVEAVGLADRLTHRPNELSGGQQQRVAVARALVSRPSIIFADEPTGNLDSRTGAEVLEFLQRASKDLNQTIVMVTHDAGAASYSDRIVFLNDGQISDEMRDPSVDRVLDVVRNLGA